MFFSASDERIRYTGRFGKTVAWTPNDNMTAVAPGSYFEFAFTGRFCELKFDLDLSYEPHGHVYIEVDGGARVEATIEKYLRLCAKDDGTHYVKVIYKSTVEQMNRWFQPLNNKMALQGIECDELVPLAPDNRKTIEIIGDSITEGVLVAENKVDIVEQKSRPWQDDVTSTYGWILAEAMDLRPYFMGFGATSLHHGGCGCVPKASEQYLYNFNDSPKTFPSCDYILINHGANDRAAGNTPRGDYLDNYADFLSLLRKENPNSTIVILSPFCGAMEDVLPDFVKKWNADNNDNVRYISSRGWVPLNPLHPLREGHATIGANLIEEWKKLGI